MSRYLSLDMGAESGRLVIVDINTEISTEVLYRFETPITPVVHNDFEMQNQEFDFGF